MPEVLMTLLFAIGPYGPWPLIIGTVCSDNGMRTACIRPRHGRHAVAHCIDRMMRLVAMQGQVA